MDNFPQGPEIKDVACRDMEKTQAKMLDRTCWVCDEKTWQAVSYEVNFSLFQLGKYTFEIFCRTCGTVYKIYLQR